MAYRLKRTVLLSAVQGVTPSAIVEKRGQAWIIDFDFLFGYDKVFVCNRKHGVFVEKGENLPVDLAEGGFAIAVFDGERIISFGQTDRITDREGVLSLAYPPYDDEAIAENDYYEAHYAQQNENAFIKKQIDRGEQTAAGGSRACQDDGFVDSYEKQKNRPHRPTENQDTGRPEQTPHIYYEKVGCALNALFDSGKPYPPLSDVVPNSRWVTVSVKGKTVYLGLQGTTPDYVCYAVKGELSAPPDGFGGEFYLPPSPFEKDKVGYFAIFQSAVDGSRIKPARKNFT